jgi:hypothetical protein
MEALWPAACLISLPSVLAMETKHSNGSGFHNLADMGIRALTGMSSSKGNEFPFNVRSISKALQVVIPICRAAIKDQPCPFISRIFSILKGSWLSMFLNGYYIQEDSSLR